MMARWLQAWPSSLKFSLWPGSDRLCELHSVYLFWLWLEGEVVTWMMAKVWAPKERSRSWHVVKITPYFRVMGRAVGLVSVALMYDLYAGVGLGLGLHLGDITIQCHVNTTRGFQLWHSPEWVARFTLALTLTLPQTPPFTVPHLQQPYL